MLNCQNVSTSKKMFYCLFLSRLLNERPGNASRFFQNHDKNLLYIWFASLYISLRLLSLCHDRQWSGSCYAQISVDHPLHTSRPMGSLGFQHTETVCKRLQIQCHPCRLIFPFPPPPPLLSFFSPFPNSRANEPVRRLNFRWPVKLFWFRCICLNSAARTS